MKFDLETYKWNVSLNFGDQLLFFDFVANFLFLSFKCGPIMLTSTNGLNILVFGHLSSLQATTENKINDKVFEMKVFSLTFNSNFMLSSSWMREQVNLNRHFSNWSIFLCWQV